MVAQILNPFYGLALANLASFAYIFVVLTHPAQKQKFIAARAAAALLYLPVLVIFYAALTVVEEASLEVEFREAYQRYQEKVRSRLIPFVF